MTKNPMTDTMLLKAGLGVEPQDVEHHRVAALVGDPRAHSRTAALASAVAVRLAREIVGESRSDASWRLIELGAATGEGWGKRPPDEALAALTGAELVVVASPVRRGSYTGLTKLFLDALPDRALAGSVAIPLMVARTPRHALAADVHLRPLLVELGASCPTPSLFALESRLSNPGAIVGAWFERARPALSHLAATD